MLNKVIYQGRLVKDPELKQTQSGVSKLLFTIAWSDKYKETEYRCFLLCKAWAQKAEFIAKYFHKGQEILIEGRMISEEWKEKETTTFCQIDRVYFCGPKVKPQEQPAADAREPYTGDFMEIPEGTDEELPFS